MQLTQLSDKVGILAVLVSCSLVFKCGVFRITAFWRSWTFRATRRATNPPFYFFARAFIFSARAVEVYHGRVWRLDGTGSQVCLCASRRYVRSVMLHCMYVS